MATRSRGLSGFETKRGCGDSETVRTGRSVTGRTQDDRHDQPPPDTAPKPPPLKAEGHKPTTYSGRDDQGHHVLNLQSSSERERGRREGSEQRTVPGVRGVQRTDVE